MICVLNINTLIMTVWWEGDLTSNDAMEQLEHGMDMKEDYEVVVLGSREQADRLRNRFADIREHEAEL